MQLGRYEHSKSGKFYKVIDVARNSEDPDEEIVYYKALYDDPKFGKNASWIRPKKMFLEDVVINGEKVPRFKFVGN